MTKNGNRGENVDEIERLLERQFRRARMWERVHFAVILFGAGVFFLACLVFDLVREWRIWTR